MFMAIGLITIAAMVGVYTVASKSESPEMVVVIVSFIAMLIFGVGNIVAKSMERIAMANQSKTEFVNIASHQLKTPLTAIKWTLNLLNDTKTGPLNESQQSYLKTLEDENKRMIKLVNDLLNVARIESGRIQIRFQAVNIVEITERTVKEVLPVARANNVVITIEKEENLPPVMTDPSYVQIVIENLINNAIKYTKDKGEIKIILKRFGKCVEFKIHDNGVGIPYHQQEKIFDKFFRSDNIMKHQTEGTGLGLFIAKAIIDSSRGKIGFNSTEGQGTTFWFTVPQVLVTK